MNCEIITRKFLHQLDLLRNYFLNAACLDAAAALERHPLVSKAAITTLHNRVLGFVVFQSPFFTDIQLEWESPLAILQVIRSSLPVLMLCVCMLSPRDIADIMKSYLQAHLKASMIHGYAMPGVIIEVDSIKHSKTGCLDPKWLKAKASSDEGYIGPQNYIETRVQRVIAAFLELPAGMSCCPGK